jgi:hypothetical protein
VLPLLSEHKYDHDIQCSIVLHDKFIEEIKVRQIVKNFMVPLWPFNIPESSLWPNMRCLLWLLFQNGIISNRHCDMMASPSFSLSASLSAISFKPCHVTAQLYSYTWSLTLVWLSDKLEDSKKNLDILNNNQANW